MSVEKVVETGNQYETCAYCGKQFQDNDPTLLFQSSGGEHICFDCVEALYNEYNQPVKKKKTDSAAKNLTPSKLKAMLDEYIIGQDEAKKILSVAAYNHYKRIKMLDNEEPGATEVEKANAVIVGPTGSGKTAMLKRIAKILSVPMTICDSSAITAAGYVGEDAEVCVRNLLQAAGGDVKKAERGIVYLDEIDKLSRKGENLSTTSDPGHEEAQQALLKIVEGSIVDVPEKGQRKHPNGAVTRVNTENILFICGGSFEGIEKIIAKRKRKGGGTIGIGAKLEKENEKSFNDFVMDVTTEDLRKFGLLPEFIGRFPIISPMKELSEGELIRILTEPKNALVKQYQLLFRQDGAELSFTESALKAIANKAIKRKTGARGLRGIMEDILGETMYSLPDEEDVEAVTVDTDDSGKIVVGREYREEKQQYGYR